MIDLHSHILPGLDDGPSDLAEAIELALASVVAGIRIVVATPHALGTYLDVDPRDRDLALAGLRDELARLRIPLRLVPGFECQVVESLPDILDAQPEYLLEGEPQALSSVDGPPREPGPVEGERPQGRMPPRAGLHAASRHVLIELSEDMPVTCLDAMLFRLQTLRITPVLAHPERHPDICRNLSAIEPFVRHGGVLQITAAALLGDAGWRQRRLCEKLLRQGLATVLATDAHRAEDAGSLPRALARATKLIGSAAEDLVIRVPAAILGLREESEARRDEG